MRYVPRHNPSSVGWCYVTQIVDKDDILHVLFTEPTCNTGMSVTNASDDVATQYVAKVLGAKDFNPARVRFFESYENGGIAEGGIDKIEYTWELVSELQKRYGMPWRGYPRGMEIIASHTGWKPGTIEDEQRFGLPPRFLGESR